MGIFIGYVSFREGTQQMSQKFRVQDTELAVILPIPRSAPDMMCCVVSGKPAW